MEQKYHWKRFWTLRDGTFRTTEKGYLADPEGPYGNILNPEIKTLAELADVPCLALLGEPGVGKSWEIAPTHILASEIENGKNVLHFELRDFQTDLKLCQDIFDNPKFRAWSNTNNRLYLFLDSLDEGLLSISTLATLLTRELKRFPPDRLYLRITCRTAEWPDILEEGLKQHWGADSFKAYELLPLRERDIIAAVHAEGIDAYQFLQELEEKEVVPLAIKPVTLKFLLNTYKKHSQLPQTQSTLYLEGCRYLCEESNRSRLASKRKGHLNADQRLAIAARLAAVCIFGNRSAIWTGLNSGDVPDSDVRISELIGGTEEFVNERFRVGDDEIRETLNTGLFSSRGPNRIGWAHQSYAEFLAARYLMEHRMSLRQKVSLITYAGDQQGRLVPQLHETAAWLAGNDTQVFQAITQADPAVLLRSDVATVDLKNKSALVEKLLQAADNDEWIDRDYKVHKYYSKLKHPTLADQLRPYILDKNKNFVARRVATDIAEACQLQSVQSELATVTLDSTDDLSVRVNAAYAVVRVGDASTRGKLKALAVGSAGDDPEDQLKGCGLRALWPDLISTSELFQLLTMPKRVSFYGAYQAFLANDLVQYLQPSHLVPALRWLRTVPNVSDSLSPFTDIRKAVVQLALEHLDEPYVTEELAEVILVISRHSYGEKDEIHADSAKRKKVLEALLPLLAPQKQDELYWLVYGRFPLLTNTDLPWLIEWLLCGPSTELEALLAEIIRNLIDFRLPEHVDLLIKASEKSVALAQQFAWFLKPVELGSPEAQAERERYEASQKRAARAKLPSLNPPPTERVATLLKRFETGDLAAWWQLNMEMTLEPDSTHYGSELQSDLKKTPGWQEATPETRANIIEAAKRYLQEAEPETKKWLSRDIVYRPAYAGYRALRLLLTEDRNFLVSLPANLWKRWAAIILTYPSENESVSAEVRRNLVESAYKHAPDEILNLILKIVDDENKRYSSLFILSILNSCWDERLSQVMTQKVCDKKLKPACMGQILAQLLARNVREAKLYAERLVKSKVRSETSKSRSAIAGRALMISADDAGWSVLWPKIQADPSFGREVIASAAHSDLKREVSIGDRLTEEQLAGLYIWMCQQYPHKDDPHYDGAHSVSPDDSARTFRDTVLRALKERGTRQAVEAIQRIMQELPELVFLKWIVLDAQEQTRRRTWAPLKSSTMIELASNDQLRLIQNGSQLLEVLIESLKRLEAKLRGETPAAIDLWNEIERGVYRPKDENRLSDYIKRHLDEDLKQRGIIANREVEIRRGEGSFEGEQTDIHVDAVVKGPHGDTYDRITAILETKCSWHRELDQAMKTQLKDRYLKENQSQHGLYVVGWFDCDQWDSKDPRKRSARRTSKEEAQRKFDAQATALSQSGTLLKAFVLNSALPSYSTVTA